MKPLPSDPSMAELEAAFPQLLGRRPVPSPREPHEIATGATYPKPPLPAGRRKPGLLDYLFGV